MANTVFDVNSPETVKLWSKKLHAEALKKTYFRKFVGSNDRSMVQELVDLKKSAGDRVRIQLNKLLTGAGVLGDAILKGNEESLSFYTDDLLIDQIRHAADAGGRMTQQRTLHDLRMICMDRLSDWMAQRMDRAFFLQLAGYTGTAVTEFGEVYDGTDVRYTGQNATLAPSSNRHFFSEVGATADEDLDSSGDNMALSLVDDLVKEAKEASPQIKPIRTNGGEYYVLFLHPRQVRDLRQDASTAGNWFDIQRARIEGGELDSNPIFTGALGVYNGVILHESTRVPQGVNSSTGAPISTVRRAIFAGAQAAAVAYGKGDSAGSMNYAEELDDYGNQLGVAAGCICGIKKTRYDGEDFGAMVLSTYAAA